MKIIAIDPDLHKSGFAVATIEKINNFGTDKNTVVSRGISIVFERIESLDMYDIMYEIMSYSSSNEDLTILLEYPENTNTYHAGGKGAALNVGKNQAVAIIIHEFLQKQGIFHKLLPPKGYSKFFKNAEFFKKQTGWTERTNEDSRAAAAMIFLNYK